MIEEETDKDFEFKRGYLDLPEDKLRKRLHKKMKRLGFSRGEIQGAIDRQIRAMESCQLWVSRKFDVRVSPDYDHLAVRFAKKDGPVHRDDLVRIGERFMNKGHAGLPVELYPDEARVLKGQLDDRHVWEIAVGREFFGAAWMEAYKRPGSLTTFRGFDCVHIPNDRPNCWADSQAIKNDAWGKDREAMDVLLPATLGRGVFLVAAPPGEAIDAGVSQQALETLVA